MEKLKRVDQPTTKIEGTIHRFDQRDWVGARAIRGEYGPLAARERPRTIPKYPIGGAINDMSDYLAPVVDGKVALTKAPISDDPKVLSRHIKRLGYFLRADIVGISQLPSYAVYSHDVDGNLLELDHKFAIMVVVDQDYETMVGSTGYDWISGSQSYMAYSASGFIACIMANYIRRLGYPARAQHVRNYQVVIPPLLLAAGIGEMSRIGNPVLNPVSRCPF